MTAAGGTDAQGASLLTTAQGASLPRTAQGASLPRTAQGASLPRTAPVALLRAVALVASVSCWLAGCASRPPDEGAPWTSGRLSVRVEAGAERGASSTSASFELRGDGDRGELRLSTPIGTLLASARWAADGVVLATGTAESRYDDLDSLSRDALGEVLPLRAFPDWLAGRPWPGAPSLVREGGFDQLGWRVSLVRFAEGWVEATRDAAPAVVVRVRLEKPA